MGSILHRILLFVSSNGLSLLEWAVRRLFECTLLDDIVITGSPQIRDRVLSGSLCGARWLPSINSTRLKRACEIAERTDAQWLLFAAPTCPFYRSSIARSLDRLRMVESGGGLCWLFAPSNPKLSLAKLGLVGEICSRQTLQKLELRFLNRRTQYVRWFKRRMKRFSCDCSPCRLHYSG